MKATKSARRTFRGFCLPSDRELSVGKWSDTFESDQKLSIGLFISKLD